MAETVSALVSEILTQGAFDLADTDVLKVLDRRHKKMVAAARAFSKTVGIGPAVAGQQAYASPAGLVETRELTVDGYTYGRARHPDLALAAQDRLSWTFDWGGVFVETTDANGVLQFSLWPVPSTSGLGIVLFGAFQPPSLLLDDTVPLRVDDDAVEGLKSGVYATLLSAPSEARSDLAGPHEQAFQVETENFRLRVKRRLRGPGPSQIRVQGLTV